MPRAGDYSECLWDFGDGQTEDGCDGPWYTYRDPGAYSVMLKVKGPGGTDRKIRSGLIVDFTNLSTGDYDECLWDFGDGSREVNCGDPMHEYEDAGEYTITLTVSGSGGEDTMIDEGCIQVASYHIFLPRIFGGS